MLDVRCAYCGHEHSKKLLPYDCPECGHDFKVFVKCPTVNGVAVSRVEHEIVAQEDRRVFDVLELSKG